MKILQMNILITGGSRGIGRGIAKELNPKGHNLLLVAKTKEHLQQAKSEMGNQQLRTEIFSCNLAEEDDIDELFAYSKKINFKPDVLIFNAGFGVLTSFIDSKFDDLNNVMALNFLHVYHAVKRFHPILKSNGTGRIYIIGSTSSSEPYPLAPLYGLSKWTLRGYALTLREELKKDNIGVTLINPGVTLTDQWNGVDLPKDKYIVPSDLGKLICATLELSEQALVEELTIRPIQGDLQ